MDTNMNIKYNYNIVTAADGDCLL